MKRKEAYIRILMDEFHVTNSIAKRILSKTTSVYYGDLLILLRSIKDDKRKDYVDCIPLFHTLAQVSSNSYMLESLFSFMKTIGIDAHTHIGLYQSIVKNVQYSESVLKAFKALTEAKVTYSEHPLIYKSVVESASLAANICEALEVMHNAGITLESNAPIFLETLETPVIAQKRTVLIKACQAAEISFEGNKDFYLRVFFKIAHAGSLAMAIQAAKSCNILFNTNVQFYTMIVDHAVNAKKLHEAFTLFNKNNIYYHDHPDWFENLIYFSEQSSETSKGVVAFYVNRHLFSGDYKYLYDLVFLSPISLQPMITRAFKRLYEAHITYSQNPELYAFMMEHLLNKLDLSEAVIKLYSANLYFTSHKRLFESIADTKHKSLDAASAILNLHNGGITYEHSKFLYHAFLRSPNISIETARTVIHQYTLGINYVNAKELFEILFASLAPISITGAIQCLCDQGMTYPTHPEMYQRVFLNTNHPELNADLLLELHRHNITCLNHKPFYDCILEHAFDFCNGGNSVLGLLKKGLVFSRHKALFKLVLQKARFPCSEAIHKLQSAGLLYQEDGAIYKHVSEFLFRDLPGSYELRANSIIMLNECKMTYEQHPEIYETVLNCNDKHISFIKSAIELIKIGFDFYDHKELFSTLPVKHVMTNSIDRAKYYKALYANNITYENSPKLYAYIKAIDNENEESSFAYQETFIILSRAKLPFHGRSDETFTLEQLKWFKYTVDSLLGSELSYADSADVFDYFFSLIRSRTVSFSSLGNKLQLINKRMSRECVANNNHEAVSSIACDSPALLQLVSGEVEIPITQGPLNKSHGTIMIEELLKTVQQNPLEELSAQYLAGSGYCLTYPSLPHKVMYISLLIKNANLSQLEYLTNEQLHYFDQYLQNQFQLRRFAEIENPLLKRMSLAHQHAFQIYSSDTQWYEHIGKLFRGEAIKFSSKDSDQMKIVAVLSSFIIGCLLNDMINKMHRKKAEILSSSPFDTLGHYLQANKEEITRSSEAYDNFLKEGKAQGHIEHAHYYCLLNQFPLIKVLFKPTGIFFDRREQISEEVIDGRIANPWALPAVTSFSARRQGVDYFKTDNHICTKLENPPETTVLTTGEMEVLFPQGLVFRTQRLQDGLLSTCINSPDHAPKDQYYTDLALHKAYATHLSKPYTNTPDFVNVQGVNINRPNHGLAHSYRKMSLISYVIQYFAKHAKEVGFKTFCAQMSDREQEIFRIAVIFGTTGRESEDSFSESPRLHSQYRKKSAENFSKFVEQCEITTESNASHTLIKNIKHAMCHIQDPNYEVACTRKHPINRNVKSETLNIRNYCYRILSLTHELDLARCRSAKNYVKAIERYKYIVNVSAPQKDNLNIIIRYVMELIKVFGDRLDCKMQLDGQIVDCSLHYSKAFLEASHSIFALDKYAAMVPKPSFGAPVGGTYLPAFGNLESQHLSQNGQDEVEIASPRKTRLH